MERAVIYLRVSTQEQADSRLGLESQLKLCYDYAVAHGLRVNEWDVPLRDEGVSASVPLLLRPGGSAIRHLPDGFAIVALSLDRLFRNVADYLATLDEFEANGITIHLVDGGVLDVSEPEQWLAQMMKIVFAEYERRMGSRRTRRALKALQDRGGKVGEPPYGWRKTEVRAQFEVDPLEQDSIRTILDYDAAGHSDREIARILNAGNIRTRDGKQWTHVQIGRILQRADEGETNGLT